jgi:hypothetical protein
MRVSDDWLGLIDEWRDEDARKLSRSEAIRHLVEVGMMSAASRLRVRQDPDSGATIVRTDRFEVIILNGDEVRVVHRARR